MFRVGLGVRKKVLQYGEADLAILGFKQETLDSFGIFKWRIYESSSASKKKEKDKQNRQNQQPEELNQEFS